MICFTDTDATGPAGILISRLRILPSSLGREQPWLPPAAAPVRSAAESEPMNDSACVPEVGAVPTVGAVGGDAAGDALPADAVGDADDVASAILSPIVTRAGTMSLWKLTRPDRVPHLCFVLAPARHVYPPAWS